MTVIVELKETSQPIRIDGVKNTYTKGPMFCIMQEYDDVVHKYPVANIFRVKEIPESEFIEVHPDRMMS